MDFPYRGNVEASKMGLFKRLFRREPEPEWFYLQELQDSGKWLNLIEPIGEELPRCQCEEFFCPGRTYRLIARSLDTGWIRTLWYHHELSYAPIRLK